MKDMTKIQREVDDKASSLPYHKTIDRLINTRLFPYLGYHPGRKIICMECGSTFEGNITKGKAVCPVCGKTLNVQESKKRTFMETRCFLYSMCFQGWQVNRYFYVIKSCKQGKTASLEIHEVMQKWVNPMGKLVVRARRFRPMSYYRDAWDYSSELKTRPYTKHVSTYFCIDRYDVGYYSSHTASILPELKRNGYDGLDHYAVDIVELQRLILTDNHVETLWKSGFFEFAKLHEKLSEFWTEVKICIRNHYHIEDVGLWKDMVSNLRELAKDTHNAVYVCPDNLTAAHDRWQHKVEAFRNRQRFLKQKEEIQSEEPGYYKRMKAFLGIVIENDAYIITPLQSVADFYREGEAMHHCVFANEYYKEAQSLILSVRDKKGNRVSTIEFDLDDMRIVQNRGIQNSVPKDKRNIDKLVKSNIKLIAKAKASSILMAQAA